MSARKIGLFLAGHTKYNFSARKIGLFLAVVGKYHLTAKIIGVFMAGERAEEFTGIYTKKAPADASAFRGPNRA